MPKGTHSFTRATRKSEWGRFLGGLFLGHFNAPHPKPRRAIPDPVSGLHFCLRKAGHTWNLMVAP